MIQQHNRINKNLRNKYVSCTHAPTYHARISSLPPRRTQHHTAAAPHHRHRVVLSSGHLLTDLPRLNPHHRCARNQEIELYETAKIMLTPELENKKQKIPSEMNQKGIKSPSYFLNSFTASSSSLQGRLIHLPCWSRLIQPILILDKL